MEPSLRFLVTNQSRNVELAATAEAAWTRWHPNARAACLKPKTGIWITPCETVHTFGLLYPVDVLFLDRQFRVCKIKQQLPPRRISVCWSAQSVLELPAGTIESTGTDIGDVIHFIRLTPPTRVLSGEIPEPAVLREESAEKAEHDAHEQEPAPASLKEALGHSAT